MRPNWLAPALGITGALIAMWVVFAPYMSTDAPANAPAEGGKFLVFLMFLVGIIALLSLAMVLVLNQQIGGLHSALQEMKTAPATSDRRAPVEASDPATRPRPAAPAVTNLVSHIEHARDAEKKGRETLHEDLRRIDTTLRESDRRVMDELKQINDRLSHLDRMNGDLSGLRTAVRNVESTQRKMTGELNEIAGTVRTLEATHATSDSVN